MKDHKVIIFKGITFDPEHDPIKTTCETWDEVREKYPKLRDKKTGEEIFGLDIGDLLHEDTKTWLPNVKRVIRRMVRLGHMSGREEAVV